MLYPDRFLPAAENSGLIVPMTMLILARPCSRSDVARVGSSPNVAVNISPRHLADVQCPARCKHCSRPRVAGVCADVRGDRELDHVRPGASGRGAARLRVLGIGVSIDDFGTGYSSLAYLRDLSATEVKIDKTFVMNASTSPRDLAIVKAAADLGHSLGLQVVAEGIEDTTTAGLMVQSGCDILQGYLILRPAPPEELVSWSKRPQVWARGLPTMPGEGAPMTHWSLRR